MRKSIILVWITTIAYLLVSPILAYASENVYEASTPAQLEQILFEAIENREEVFKVTYLGNTENIMAEVRTARDNAVKRDPYEEGCIALISGFKVSKVDNRADISFTGFKYYTTKAQENYVDAEVVRIAQSIVEASMSDLAKVKAIHKYIIGQVEYDESLVGYTAYSALSAGKTVCNGYVQLAYRLLNQVGIENIIVKGTHIENGFSTDHAWNLVNIDGKWYHIDITLNDRYTDGEYPYFNLTNEEILRDHNYVVSDYPVANTQYVPEDNSKGGSNTESPTKRLRVVPKLSFENQEASEKTKISLKQLELSSMEAALDKAKTLQAEILVEPIETVLDNGKRLDKYVVLNYELGSGLDGKNLIGVMYNERTGEFEPVPTTIKVIDGKTMVTLKTREQGRFLLLEHNKSFSDIEGHWAKTEIERLASKLVIKGKSEENFDPKGQVTRAEFASLLVRALGVKTNDPKANFTDVKDQWYASAVNTAAELGLVQGYADNSFMPNGIITRQEMAVMIERALEATDTKIEVEADQHLAKFADGEGIKGWAKNAIAKNVSADIFKGDSQGKFNPNAATTRAEAAMILLRTLVHTGLS